MFAEQRRSKILQLLNEYKEVNVNSLTNILSVSEATVRRDLESLEKMGRLCRTHGGAILIDDPQPILRLENEDATVDLEEIKVIGDAAAKYIANGEIIAIGSGDIGVFIARAIPKDINCTVVTNSTSVMFAVIQNKSVRVIFLGGVAKVSRGNNVTVTGEFTRKMLEGLHIDKVFIEPDGVDIDAGVTIDDYEDSLIFSSFADVADETVIAAKSCVFDKKKLIKLCPCFRINCIFSSKELASKYKDFFFQNGIPIHIGYNL